MNFNSHNFILFFLPFVLVLYYVVCNKASIKTSNKYLLAISVLFYSCFSKKFLLVIGISIIVNYFISQNILKRKAFLTVGLVFNVFLLGIFKYYDFFIESFNKFFSLDIGVLKLAVPIGISFFTFQQIAYLVDSYKNRYDYTFIEYSLHVMFFGYIISGPLVNHDQIIYQFRDKELKKLNYDNLLRGFYCFSKGLFKKVIIADTLAKVVAIGYGAIDQLNSTTAIIVMLSYTFQIYFDFSGYSEMASGVSYMLNIELPMNFDCPYKSTSIKEFWSKWHMSVTKFLTKYIYFPIGGNRKGTFRTYVNILIVFVISGLWHGSGLTFIMWGLGHGILNCANRFIKKWDKLNETFKWIITFGFVNLFWILFRSGTLTEALIFFKKVVSCDFGNTYMLTSAFMLPEVSFLMDITKNSIPVLYKMMPIIILFSLLLYVLVEKNIVKQVKENFNELINWKRTVFYSLIMFWSFISISGVGTFIYAGF